MFLNFDVALYLIKMILQTSKYWNSSTCHPKWRETPYETYNWMYSSNDISWFRKLFPNLQSKENIKNALLAYFQKNQ